MDFANYIALAISCKCRNSYSPMKRRKEKEQRTEGEQRERSDIYLPNKEKKTAQKEHGQEGRQESERNQVLIHSLF